MFDVIYLISTNKTPLSTFERLQINPLIIVRVGYPLVNQQPRKTSMFNSEFI